MPVTEGQLALHQERQLLVVPGAELDAVQTGEIVRSENPYLGTDVYQGSYGVASFGLVIPHPKRRPTIYSAEEGPVSNFDNDSIIASAYPDDPIRQAHFNNTEKGFAVVRAVLAPEEVETGFQEDRFLDPAVIDKCCLEGTVPTELDEQTKIAAQTSDTMYIDYSAGLAIDMENYVPVTDRICNRLEEATGRSYTMIREYPSWHSYRVYTKVLDQIAEGCQGTVANFDEVLAKLVGDSVPRFHDFERQAMSAGTIALLPEGKPGAE